MSPQEFRKKPIEHGIPEGRVDKKVSSIPILSVITADKVRVTTATARHIAMIFIKRLYDLNTDAGGLDIGLEKNIVNEIRAAIPRGIILYNNQSDDTYNPLDRQLEIYSYVKLGEIDRSLNGIAKLRIICRLSLSNGILSLRTIDKNFNIE